MGTIALTRYRPSLPALATALALAFPPALAGQQTSAPHRQPDVHFVPTDTTKVREMLTAANVSPNDLVYDLGCGDGRFVITAVKKFKARRGVCVDIDPVRIKESKSNADTAGVKNKIEFVEGDLFEQDLSKATVITLYLLPSLNERLRPKLFRETRPGTRIVSNAFDMGDWKADRNMTVKMNSGMQSYAYLWIMPADVSGQWRLTTEGGSAKEYALDVKQKYQEVSGTATVDGKTTPLSALTVQGDQVSFTLGDGADRVDYTGKVADGKASGTAKGKGGSFGWSAERTKPGERPDTVSAAGT
jgi:SAM-dependent methyltransferase